MLRAVADAQIKSAIFKVFSTLLGVSHALLDVLWQQAQIAEHSDTNPVSLDAAARFAQVCELLTAEVHERVDLDLWAVQIVLGKRVDGE